jgi:hypothetical protein
MEEMKVMRDGGVGQDTHKGGVEIEDGMTNTRTTITAPDELIAFASRSHLIPLGVYEEMTGLCLASGLCATRARGRRRRPIPA